MATICVPVCADRFDKMRQAVKRASQYADIIELRLDCVKRETLPEVLEKYRELREISGKPFIVTYRPAEQGGHPLSRQERMDFWQHRSKFWNGSELQPADYSDIEAELLVNQSPKTEIWRSHLKDHRLICSHHDFVGVPHNLEELYEQMAASSAAITKLAVQAEDAIDCLPIFRLLDRSRREGRDLIAIAMGPAGILTRILGPSRGSFLTYGSLDDESATAPGQVSARDLREVYRIDQINLETQVFGIIGKPVSHSLSPRIHNAAFAAAGMNSVYVPMEVQDASSFMRRMAHPKTRELDWKLHGLSVTAPHKSIVIQNLDSIDPTAREIGAVNTIVAKDDQLFGYNTDAEGFISPLRTRLADLRDARCAVIGSGGATRAVLWALRSAGADATLVARNRERANELAQRFKAACPPRRPEKFSSFDVVINATPLGTVGLTVNETPATAEQLRGVRLAYDLVYNPSETRFLTEARRAGCEILGGIEMLLAQAVEQFKLWTGSEPDQTAMRAAAINALAVSHEIQ